MMKANGYTRIGPCTDEKLLQIMEAIRDNPDFREDKMGICGGVDLYGHSEGWVFESSDSYDLRYLMSLWPKFSGKDFYPVPSTTGGVDAHDAFHSCMECWNKNTEYGQLRWELLEFCIERLKDRIYEDKIS